MNFSLELCEDAKSVLSKYLTPTPLIKNAYLSKKYGANVYLKLENMQPVGSFKLRGAIYKIANLTNEERAKGVLAVSAGNHAQGVAYAAGLFAAEATIIMPKLSPLIKIANTEALGAKVILQGENVDEGFVYAKELIKEKGMTFVHPFCDAHIIAGQSTIAYEILDKLPQVDYVFTGIGGGGLIAGIATVLKDKTQAKIVGAQAAGSSSMVDSLKANALQVGTSAKTFADGIRVKMANSEMFELMKDKVDLAVAVDDDKIVQSLLTLMEHARIITEGAGAIGLAALDEVYKNDPTAIQDKNIVLIISGGNIDINLVDRIIDKGLLETNRRIKLRVLLEDRPGSLNRLTSFISELGANILQVIHDREMLQLDLQKSAVILSLETKGEEHALQIEKALSENFQIISKN